VNPIVLRILLLFSYIIKCVILLWLDPLPTYPPKVSGTWSTNTTLCGLSVEYYGLLSDFQKPSDQIVILKRVKWFRAVSIIECRKTNTKVITLANRKGHRHPANQSKHEVITCIWYTSQENIHCMQTSHNFYWFCFYFWLDEKVAQVFLSQLCSVVHVEPITFQHSNENHSAGWQKILSAFSGGFVSVSITVVYICDVCDFLNIALC